MKILTRLSIASKTNVVVIKYICLRVDYNILKFRNNILKIDQVISKNTYEVIKRDLSVKTTSNLFCEQINPRFTSVPNFKFLAQKNLKISKKYP